MSISSTAWRANVRTAYADGTACASNRGAWGNREKRYRQPFIGEFEQLWPHFSPIGDITLTLAETYEETREEVTTYLDATPTLTNTDTIESTADAAETVPKSDIVGYGEELPGGFARRYHSSATPYGEGLYDTKGAIIVYAPTTIHEVYTYGVVSGLPDTDETTIPTLTYNFAYSSHSAVINGLDTFCRLTIGQYFHGPNAAFRQNVELVTDNPGSASDEFNLTPIFFTPLEKDPDGVEYNDPLHLDVVEVYFTDSVLRDLSDSSISMSMERITGSAARTVPSYDDTSNVDQVAWTHDWSRAGTLTLAITPA